MVLVGIVVGVGFSSRNIVSVMGCTILPVAVEIMCLVLTTVKYKETSFERSCRLRCVFNFLKKKC